VRHWLALGVVLFPGLERRDAPGVDAVAAAAAASPNTCVPCVLDRS